MSMKLDEQRTSVYFGRNDSDVLLALNKMCLDDNRSKNNIIQIALKSFLINKGYLNGEGKYITGAN